MLLFSPKIDNYLISMGNENDKGLFVWDIEKSTRLTLNKISRKINAIIFND